ncbi:hypothetical protein BV25DRAFT_496106 [Artomyces pyxidatus]|uniref:Uncharacterized protein n=1 Tax=Artomyces pyxidatus TaxID=48021 RepID=A0ACB8T4G9_9AGAM|nr:hypothetical protein BV25DRAFT_496106 [Artomyces pyxidatus]
MGPAIVLAGHRQLRSRCPPAVCIAPDGVVGRRLPSAVPFGAGAVHTCARRRRQVSPAIRYCILLCPRNPHSAPSMPTWEHRPPIVCARAFVQHLPPFNCDLRLRSDASAYKTVDGAAHRTITQSSLSPPRHPFAPPSIILTALALSAQMDSFTGLSFNLPAFSSAEPIAEPSGAVDSTPFPVDAETNGGGTRICCVVA